VAAAGLRAVALLGLLARCEAVAVQRPGLLSSRVARRCAAQRLQEQSEGPSAAGAEAAAVAASTEAAEGVAGGSDAVANSIAMGGDVDLASLDFDQRLQVLASRIPEKAAPPEKEDDSVFPDGSPETRFWNPAFWALCAEDLKELQWPSRKSVAQTLFISQIAFVVIIVLTLTFDAVIESGVRTLLLDEPFTLSVDKILKLGGSAVGS